jgi:Ca2+:H+ antiporter
MLAIAGVAVGVMSEILVGSITEASESVGLSTFFVGIGPDRAVRGRGARPAVVLRRAVPDATRLQRPRARRDRPRRADRHQVTQEGESTWFEGLGLLGVYLVFGIVFFYVGG